VGMMIFLCLKKQEYHWKIVKNNDKMEIKERYYKRKTS